MKTGGQGETKYIFFCLTSPTLFAMLSKMLNIQNSELKVAGFVTNGQVIFPFGYMKAWFN
jgi:hypothetical protein